MWGIPRSCHRFLIEPITGKRHLKKTLIRRFLSFIESVKSSKKIALKNLFKIVKTDCRSVTGRNLSMIGNLVGKTCDNLGPADADNIDYFVIPQSESWRISIVNEITDTKFGEASVEGFSRDELKAILINVCSSWINQLITVTKWPFMACNALQCWKTFWWRFYLLWHTSALFIH